MKKWLRLLRGALGLGLTWGAGGAVLGLGIEVVHFVRPNPLGALVTLWPPLLAVIGFVGGTAFAVVLGVAARRHRFSDLSLPGFTALGALVGLLLGEAALATGFAVHVSDPWLRTVLALTPPAVGCALGASLSLARARTVESSRALGEDAAMRLFDGRT